MLKYNGVEYRSLEEQVRKNMEDISELKEGSGSTPVQEDFPKAVPLGDDLPTTATQGTIEAEKIAVLDANKGNFVYWQGKKIFTQQENNGTQITLIHIDNEKAEQLTITRATLGFVITEISLGGGGDKNSRYGIAPLNSKGQREIPLGSWEGVYAKRVTVRQPIAASLTEIGYVDIENNQDYNYLIDNDVQGIYFGLQIVIGKNGHPYEAYPMFKVEVDAGAEGVWVIQNGPYVENVQKLFIVEQSTGSDYTDVIYIVEDLYE